MQRILLNLLGVAAFAYGASFQEGFSPQDAATTAAIAVIGNLVGLYQPQPKKPTPPT